MSENKIESDSDVPLIPDTTPTSLTTSSKNLLSSFVLNNPNEKNLVVTDEKSDQFDEKSIVAENDLNGNHLVITDENCGVDKDLTISKVEPSNEYESIIGSSYLDYLDELERTFHIVPKYEEEVEIIIKKVDKAV